MDSANSRVASLVMGATSRTVRSSPLMRKMGGNPTLRWISEAPSCRAALRTRSKTGCMAGEYHTPAEPIHEEKPQCRGLTGHTLLDTLCKSRALSELRRRNRRARHFLRALRNARGDASERQPPNRDPGRPGGTG